MHGGRGPGPRSRPTAAAVAAGGNDWRIGDRDGRRGAGRRRRTAFGPWQLASWQASGEPEIAPRREQTDLAARRTGEAQPAGLLRLLRLAAERLRSPQLR